MKLDFDQRARMEELATDDPEYLAEMVVTLESELRRCRAETLREAAGKIDDLEWPFVDLSAHEEDVIEEAYGYVRAMLSSMADEAEREAHG